MKQRLLVTIILLIGAMLIARPARACEPCVEILNLEETTAEADVILVGQLLREGPSTGMGPDWLEIAVLEVWKGEVNQSVLRVNSWDGMCAYGIILFDRQPHVIFLEQRGDMFDTVEFGCSVRHILIENGQIEYEDHLYSVDEFAVLLGPSIERHVLPSTDASIPWTPVVVGGLLILAMTGGFYLVLKRMSRP